ncbi:hypothetical protein M9H77_02690 [Catharanthus roseus]|uniref:Uncharacterized protein n=1 Tax=Catharanthus roseus TaxID=4058 RepID=A0ACC0C9D9_CATRO|nr:hypothetical protein M9H77_02690 [Catharanthus roseus]
MKNHQRRPPEVELKLNVDVSWTIYTVGIGGVLRLWKAERFGYRSFILESDCKSVADQLNSRIGSSSVLGLYYSRIWALMQKLHVSIYHIKRSINVLVHKLASSAVTKYPSNIWMKVVPDIIATAVYADI